MIYSERTNWNAAPTPLSAAVAHARRSGRALLDLTETNPTRCGFGYPACDGGIELALAQPDARLYDPHPFGLPAAREAVARLYAGQGIAVDPARILLTAGTSEAYAHLMRLLLAPGERLLVPTPSYPLLDVLARLHDVELRPYPLHYDGRWWIDLEALRRAADASCRALVVISPNNPTGSCLSRTERDALLALAAERGLAIIADEVFMDYGIEPAADAAGSLAAVADAPAPVFVLNGISKMLGLPQMKLAWTLVGGPAPLADDALRRLEIIADAYLSVGTPVQLALESWLPRRTSVQAEIMDRVRTNLAALRAVPSVNPLHVEAGWVAIVRVPAIHRGEAAALALLEQHDVVVDPGDLFGLPPSGYLVLSLLPPPEVFAEGLRRLAAWVAT